MVHQLTAPLSVEPLVSSGRRCSLRSDSLIAGVVLISKTDWFTNNLLTVLSRSIFFDPRQLDLLKKELFTKSLDMELMHYSNFILTHNDNNTY